MTASVTSPPSERQPRPNLHGSGSCLGQPAEGAVIDRSHQSAQVGVVERIERIGAQLKAKALRELQRFGEAGIQIFQTRNTDGIPAQVAWSYLLGAQW